MAESTCFPIDGNLRGVLQERLNVRRSSNHRSPCKLGLSSGFQKRKYLYVLRITRVYFAEFHAQSSEVEGRIGPTNLEIQASRNPTSDFVGTKATWHIFCMSTHLAVCCLAICFSDTVPFLILSSE